ncbi:MAG: YdcF family protein [Lachnospiraceae bacterium]|nr:YdcF family protein [Lachnospiraceae bacterium]
MASQKKGKRSNRKSSNTRSRSSGSRSSSAKTTSSHSSSTRSNSTRNSSTRKSSASKAEPKKRFGAKKIILLLAAALVLAVVIINLIVVLYPMGRIIDAEKAKAEIDENGEFDCIMVLGCGLWDNEPSPMLKGRLDTAIALYKDGISDKLLMTGDHGRADYNEVGAMKMYAINQGVPSEDIYLDHAGYSTYESMKRAERIYGVKRMIVVTQKYHMYRALYDADLAEIDVYGICDETSYNGQFARDAREVLARCKDFFVSMFQPNAKEMGDPISMDGSGDDTDDLYYFEEEPET